MAFAQHTRTIAPASTARRAGVVARATRPGRVEGPSKWATQYRGLKDYGLVSVEPEEAAQKIASDKYVLVDVRPKAQFEKAHPTGAVNVPLYQGLDFSTGNVAGKAFRFLAFAANGVTPIEPNPVFSEQLTEALAGKGAIFCCEAGGTLRETVNFPQGKASRSLQACHRALNEKVTDDVLHLNRGLFGWFQSDMTFEGDEEYQPDIGRTPMAAKDPTLINAAQSGGYEFREDDAKEVLKK